MHLKDHVIMFSSHLRIRNPFAKAPALTARQKTVQKVKDVVDAADKYIRVTHHFGAGAINTDRNLAPQYAGRFDQALNRLNSPSTDTLELKLEEHDPVKTGQFIIAPISTLPSLLGGQKKIETAQAKIGRMVGVTPPSGRRVLGSSSTTPASQPRSLSDMSKALRVSLGLSPNASRSELSQAQKEQAEMDRVLEISKTDVGGRNQPKNVGSSFASSSRTV